jgi:hypothetical protein
MNPDLPPQPSRMGMHDLLLPSPVSLWPATPAWAVLGALLLALLLWLVWRGWHAWHQGAYRREALRALDAAQTPEEIAALLKRTALAAWPRAEVAALSGDDWAGFLRRTAPRAHLTEDAARSLSAIACAPAMAEGARAAAWLWVRHHDLRA